MRSLIMDPRVLRRTARDLDSAGDDTASALGAVEPPTAGYAWRRLVDKGVSELLDDARRVARDCRWIGEALEEALVAVEEADGRTARPASGRR